MSQTLSSLLLHEADGTVIHLAINTNANKNNYIEV